MWALKSLHRKLLSVRIVTFTLLLTFTSALVQSSNAAAQAQIPFGESGINSGIVIGFVGGFVHKDDARHSEVQLGRRLQSMYGDGLHVDILQNRQVAEAQKEVLHWLDQNSDGNLSLVEKQHARIILFGHSWGAAAAVSLARELQRKGIPVLLTVQIDTVKKGGDNSTIPDNVSEAANFYQTGGILHGQSRIIAADQSRTRILGNFRFDYDKEPPACRAYPWYDRFFFKGHTAIECDPQVWSQVESLIRARLAPPIVTISQVQPAK